MIGVALRSVRTRARALALCWLCANGVACAGEAVYLSRTASGMAEYTNRPSVGARRLFIVTDERRGGGERAAGKAAIVDVRIDAMIKSAALTHRVEEALLRAVIQVESNFNPLARSSAGAFGLMQLMPDTARRYGVADVSDAWQNIDGGTRYLKDLLTMFGGDVSLALAAYNAGEGAVIRFGSKIPPFHETRAYVPAVLARYASQLKRPTD